MSDIRFNQWLHQSGTGGVSQSDGGHVGIGTTNPLIPVGAGNTHILNVGVVTCNNIAAGSSITAGTFYGSGANLTSLPSQLTLSNNADNRVITGGSGTNLNGEANLTFDGNNLNQTIDNSGEGIRITAPNNHYSVLRFDSNASSANGSLCNIQGHWNGNEVANIIFSAGSDTTNKDDGYIRMYTRESGQSNTERLRINSTGQVLVNTTTATNADNRIESHSAGGYNIVAKSTNGNGGYQNFTGLASNGTVTSYITHNGRGYFEDGVQFDSSGEVLDAYEEGSWTPYFIVNGGTSGVTQPSSMQGRYTKIGERVCVNAWGNGTLVYTGSTGHSVALKGLPFNANGGNMFSAFSHWLYRFATNVGDVNKHIIFRTNNSSDQIEVQKNNSSGCTYADFNGVSGNWIIAAHYRAT